MFRFDRHYKYLDLLGRRGGPMLSPQSGLSLLGNNGDKFPEYSRQGPDSCDS